MGARQSVVAIADDEAVALEEEDKMAVRRRADKLDTRDHFHIRGRRPIPDDQRVLTGTQIKALAKKPPGNRLFRLSLARDSDRKRRKSMREGERFAALPPVAAS